MNPETQEFQMPEETREAIDSAIKPLIEQAREVVATFYADTSTVPDEADTAIAHHKAIFGLQKAIDDCEGKEVKDG